MDGEDYLLLGTLVFFGMLFLMIIVAIGLVAGYIASCIGCTGLVWWAFVIVFYLIIAGFIGMLNRIGD